MLEIYYESPYNIDWQCTVCRKNIPAEPNQAIQDGKIVTVYTPSSRYWNPATKPGITNGIFCGPECSKIHLDITQKLFPSTNNELPEGL